MYTQIIYKISHLIRSVRNTPILSSLCFASITIMMYSIVLISNGCSSSQLVAKYHMGKDQFKRKPLSHNDHATDQRSNERRDLSHDDYATDQRSNERRGLNHDDYATDQQSNRYRPIDGNRNRRKVLPPNNVGNCYYPGNTTKHNSSPVSIRSIDTSAALLNRSRNQRFRQDGIVSQLDRLINDDCPHLCLSLIRERVNTYSKQKSSNSYLCDDLAGYLINHFHHLVRNRPDNMGKELSLLVNGFSKWPKSKNCQQAAGCIAAYINKGGINFSEWRPQALSNLVNGFSKWPSSENCQEAAGCIAAYINKGDINFSEWGSQALSILVNGFSKWPKSKNCQQAAGCIAAYINKGGINFSEWGSQALSILVNGFSKRPKSKNCQQAAGCIAAYINKGNINFSEWQSQELSALVNGFSKWPSSENCQQAAGCIAAYINKGGINFSEWRPQALSTLVNGFSKWPSSENCQQAAGCIAAYIKKGNINFSEWGSQELSALVNGFSKWPNSPACQEAAGKIAAYIRQGNIEFEKSDWGPQDLSTLVNGFSKWPNSPACQEAAGCIAAYIKKGNIKFSDWGPQDLSTLVNGFSKWPNSPACQEAAGCIAAYIVKKCDRVDQPDIYFKKEEWGPQDLSTLVNGFSKWPNSPACQEAAGCIAAYIVKKFDRVDQPDIYFKKEEWGPQDLSTLVNGFSKWPNSPACQEAAGCIAAYIVEKCDRVDQSDIYFKQGDWQPQELSNLVNGFSKWPNSPACQEAAGCIAAYIVKKFDRVDQPDIYFKKEEWGPQDLSTLVNGFSKWPNSPACQEAAGCIAAYIRQGNIEFEKSEWGPQALSTLVNGFSKWPDLENCQQAAGCIAAYIVKKCDRVDQPDIYFKKEDWGPQDLSTLVNGFSKWPKSPACQEAAGCIAAYIVEKFDRVDQSDIYFKKEEWGPQELSTLVNGFSKWPKSPACQEAAGCIAVYIRQGNIEFEKSEWGPQALSNLVNGFSKWPDSPACQEAAGYIAAYIVKKCDRVDHPDIYFKKEEWGPQELSNLVNGFSKWPDSPACQEAAGKIAAYISKGDINFSDWGPQALSNLVNGFSKWPNSENCQEVVGRIAAYIKKGNIKFEESDWESQALSNLVNGFSKWPDSPACQEAAGCIAAYINKGNINFSEWEPQALASLVNGFSKWPQEDQMQEACKKVAHSMVKNQRVINELQAFAELVSSFARFLYQDNSDLSLFTDTDKDEVFIAVLCSLADQAKNNAALISNMDILGVSRLLKASCHLIIHNNIALAGYKAIIPNLVERIKMLVADQGVLNTTGLETLGTLCIGLLYPLRKSTDYGLNDHNAVRRILSDLFSTVKSKSDLYMKENKNREAEVSCPAYYNTRCAALTYYQFLKAYDAFANLVTSKQTKEIRKWLESILDKFKEQIIKFSPYTFNLVAKLESELDRAEDIHQVASTLDHFVAKHFKVLDRELNPKLACDKKDLFGDLPSSLSCPKIASGSLELLKVDINGKPINEKNRSISYCILGRLFGTELKANKIPPLQVALPSPYVSNFYMHRFIYHNKTPYRLDLFGGNNMKGSSQTVETLLKQKTIDDHGALLAMPLSELNRNSLFGAFISRLFPNKESFFYFQRALLAAPMGQTNKPEKAVLEGKFKLKIYERYPDDVSHPFKVNGLQLRPHDGCGFIKQTVANKMCIDIPEGAKNKSSYLPAQALQHYTIDPDRKDQIKKLQADLESKLENEIKYLKSSNADHGARVFRLLTSGGIKGRSLVALPSSDDKVYGSKLAAKLLLGRAPYDQPNLCPIEKVGSQGDNTTRFLEKEVKVIQYSLVAQDMDSTDRSQATQPIWFAKGLLVIIPDEDWPSDLNEIDIVLSLDDIKTHSSWTDAEKKQHFKDKFKDKTLAVAGILVAINAYGPSDCIALPIEHQSYLSGDFDGDRVLVIDIDKDDSPLYQVVKEAYHASKHSRCEKPNKTFNAAWENGDYYFGRAEEILSTKAQVLECFSTLQARFLALKKEKRNAIQKKVRDMIEQDDNLKQKFLNLLLKDLDMLLRLGIKVGTDAYKSATDVKAYAQLAKKLISIFNEEKIEYVPYSKALARTMGKQKLNLCSLEDKLNDNPTLAAKCMQISLNKLKAREGILNPYLAEADQLKEAA